MRLPGPPGFGVTIQRFAHFNDRVAKFAGPLRRPEPALRSGRRRWRSNKKIEIAISCSDVWFLCLIMTHRGDPYLLFLTVEAWAGAYPFLWSRCIITNYSFSCIDSRWIKAYCFLLTFLMFSELRSEIILTFLIISLTTLRNIDL